MNLPGYDAWKKDTQMTNAGELKQGMALSAVQTPDHNAERDQVWCLHRNRLDHAFLCGWLGHGVAHINGQTMTDEELIDIATDFQDGLLCIEVLAFVLSLAFSIYLVFFGYQVAYRGFDPFDNRQYVRAICYIGLGCFIVLVAASALPGFSHWLLFEGGITHLRGD